MKSGIKVIGRVNITVLGEDGNIKKEVTKDNLVVNYGTSLMAKYLGGQTPTKMQYVAVGSDSSAPAAGNTSLVTELFRKLASVVVGTGPDANKTTFQATWTAGTATGTFREAGIFDASSLGNMFSRVVFADVVVGAADTLIVTWDVSFVGA